MALPVQHIGDELKMQVGRQALIDRRVACIGDVRSLFHRHAAVKAIDEVGAEISVERVEGKLTISDGVL